MIYTWQCKSQQHDVQFYLTISSENEIASDDPGIWILPLLFLLTYVWSMSQVAVSLGPQWFTDGNTDPSPQDTLGSMTATWLILGLRPANERRRYFATTSLIGWAQT